MGHLSPFSESYPAGVALIVRDVDSIVLPSKEGGMNPIPM